jgi:hypothetical protein
MTTASDIRRDLAAICAKAQELVLKDGESAPANGPTASDVHVPVPLGAGKKLKERAKELHARLDKALGVRREALRRHAQKKADRAEARRRAAAVRAKNAQTSMDVVK